MKKYNILWFDDEYSTLDLIKEQATLNGINHIGFENAEDGIAELEKNYMNYDAVLIDGIFYRKAGQSGDNKSDLALAEVFQKLEILKAKKILPSFILSGQKSFTTDTNPFADFFKGNKVYDKQSEKDLVKLWNDIKSAADKQIETQICHKYQRVFDVCAEKYIGINANNELLDILMKEHSEWAFIDPKLYFNPLRKIMDDFFKACNKYGFLPDIFAKPSVALNESSKFLSGSMVKGYQLDNPLFPKVVSDNVRNILSVCQPASHRAEIDTFIEIVDSPYLLLSITYQLFDVLLWFKSCVDSNSDVELNKAKFKAVDAGIDSGIVTGILEQDDDRNYHCGDILLTYKEVKENGLKLGDEIRIIKYATNSNPKTMQLYKKSALQTEKL